MLRFSLLCLIVSMCVASARATDLDRLRSLVREGHISAASALLSAEIALDSQGGARERLRLYLLKSILEGTRGRFSRAQEWLDLATSHWRGSLGADAAYGTEIELTRHDLQVMERKGVP